MRAVRALSYKFLDRVWVQSAHYCFVTSPKKQPKSLFSRFTRPGAQMFCPNVVNRDINIKYTSLERCLPIFASIRAVVVEIFLIKMPQNGRFWTFELLELKFFIKRG